MARILVVDDSPTVFYVVRKALAADGHDVDRLHAFTQLAAYMAAKKPDLVLLDLEMPAIPGQAFAQFIRRNGGERTPILIHSSLPDEALAQAAEEVGAMGFVPKRTPGDRLRHIVHETLQRATPRSGMWSRVGAPGHDAARSR